MFSNLSKRQWLYLFLTIATGAAIIVSGFVLNSKKANESVPGITMDMSIKQIAPLLHVTPKSLTRELGLPLNISKGKPLRTLGVSKEKMMAVARHLWSHQGGQLKYYFYVALVLFGLVYLARLGRPDGSAIVDRATWYSRWPHRVCLLLAVLVCGFALGKSPNPMEGAVKLSKSLAGLYPAIWPKAMLFIFFVTLSMIGTKLICGWACPFGALQELIYDLPILRKLKQKKLPFFISNSIRILLFVSMLLIMFGLIGNRKGLVIYHFINPFNLFNLEIETLSILGIIIGSLLVSLGFYRPFCRFVCPFGLLSWMLERLSVFRVWIDHSRCIDCGACSRSCPLGAAADRVKNKNFPEDCFSCGRCLNTCPVDAIHYTCPGKKHSALHKKKMNSSQSSYDKDSHV